jgi:hypothetical protein
MSAQKISNSVVWSFILMFLNLVSCIASVLTSSAKQWVGGGAPWFDKMCWPVKNPQERVAHAQSCGDNENKFRIKYADTGIPELMIDQ